MAKTKSLKKIDVIGCNGFYTFIISVLVSRFYGFDVVRFRGDLRKQEGTYFGSSFFNFLYKIPKSILAIFTWTNYY